MKRLFLPALLALISVTFSSCVEEQEGYDAFRQLEADVATIDAHLTAQGISAIKDLSGLRIHITQLGTGIPAAVFNTVEVGYTGSVLGSTTPFEQGRTYNGLLSGVIPGWQTAFQTLPAGTKGTLYIPSPLAYMNQARANIPANSILVFEFDFKGVVRSESEKNKFTQDTTAIKNYVAAKGWTDVVKDPSGIRYRITQAGTGPEPEVFDKVTMKLDFKNLTDDTKIVATVNRAPSENFASRVVDQNIPGLTALLTNLPQGSKATVLIPSILAFGPNTIYDKGVAIFTPGSNVIIDVDLTLVE